MEWKVLIQTRPACSPLAVAHDFHLASRFVGEGQTQDRVRLIPLWINSATRSVKTLVFPEPGTALTTQAPCM
jgi:hypothetical protein